MVRWLDSWIAGWLDGEMVGYLVSSCFEGYIGGFGDSLI